jgi:hypothetical protein
VEIDVGNNWKCWWPLEQSASHGLNLTIPFRTLWQESQKMKLKQHNYPTVPKIVPSGVLAKMIEIVSGWEIRRLLVPGGGIEPSIHGFSVITPEFHNFLKYSNLLKTFIFLVAVYCWFSLDLGTF